MNPIVEKLIDPFLEEDEKNNENVKTVKIQNFSIEYETISEDDTSGIIETETISKSDGFILTNFAAKVGDAIADKTNGNITINFTLEDLIREEQQYSIEIKYTHSDEDQIAYFKIVSNGKTKEYDVNNFKPDKKGKTFRELEVLKQTFFRKYDIDEVQLDKQTFFKLLQTIFVALKRILITKNYTQEPNIPELPKNEKKQLSKIEKVELKD